MPNTQYLAKRVHMQCNNTEKIADIQGTLWQQATELLYGGSGCIICMFGRTKSETKLHDAIISIVQVLHPRLVTF